jgi:threonine dehydrogenase-like Zn-dependent dehydrogenase
VREEDLIAEIKALAGEDFVLYGPPPPAISMWPSKPRGSLNQAQELVKPVTGRLICVALYEDKPEMDINQIVSKNLSFLGVLGYTEEDVSRALNLIADGKVDRTPLTTHRYALAEASEAFAAQIDTPETLKAVIKP